MNIDVYVIVEINRTVVNTVSDQHKLNKRLQFKKTLFVAFLLTFTVVLHVLSLFTVCLFFLFAKM